MPDNTAATALFQALRLPFRMRKSPPPQPPRKAIILQPCCLGQVMLTTPLLAALSEGFPEARFDWAVSDQARMGIAGNRRLTRLISTGAAELREENTREIATLIDRLKAEAYDTCFIPNSSSLVTTIAWRAGIPQRIGMDLRGHGYAHTTAVPWPKDETRLAAVYLRLAEAAGVSADVIDRAEMEFDPADSDRLAITRWLVEEFDWLGDTPLAVLHPGGEDGLRLGAHETKLWPAKRYARLANYLAREQGARVVLAGSAADRPLAAEVAGMMTFPAANRAGQMSLGELGALCELASLYVGNDVGPSYTAAATGCPTVVIYGPTNSALNMPYTRSGLVRPLWRPWQGAFSWDDGVSVDEAAAAAAELLRPVAAGQPS
jgi:ADP-heptose:LPS heptosyltransferase